MAFWTRLWNSYCDLYKAAVPLDASELARQVASVFISDVFVHEMCVCYVDKTAKDPYLWYVNNARHCNNAVSKNSLNKAILSLRLLACKTCTQCNTFIYVNLCIFVFCQRIFFLVTGYLHPVGQRLKQQYKVKKNRLFTCLLNKVCPCENICLKTATNRLF